MLNDQRGTSRGGTTTTYLFSHFPFNYREYDM